MAQAPPTQIRLAVAQCHTLPTLSATLSALEETSTAAMRQGVDLVLFPEAYLGGYPRGASFGASVGERAVAGREQYLEHFKGAVDLGDAPREMGERWVRRDWGSGKTEGGGEGMEERRGDGTREELERISQESGVVIVVGIVERAGGTLYCSVVYVDPQRGVIGKRRKVMPTGSERLIWGQGQPSNLRAVTTTIRDVKITLAAAICWENYMPLLRYSLYSQNVNLYLAPTADARDTWLPLMRTVASEGRCFVLSSNQCVRKDDLPDWIHGGRQEQNILSRAAVPPLRRGSSSVIQDSGSTTPKMGDRFGKGRRKSIFTDDGHEICLSSNTKEEDVMEQPTTMDDSESQEQNGNAAGKERRKSVFTVDGHKICLSSNVKEDDAKEPPTTLSDSGSTEQNQNAPGKERRKSVFTKDGHKICLPSHTETGTGDDLSLGIDDTGVPGTEKKRRESIFTEEGHAIVLPRDGKQSAKRESTETDAFANAAPTNGHHRRKSFWTEDGHEICLPTNGGANLYSALEDQGGRGALSGFACRGGSCIISPSGEVLAGPLWEIEDDLLVVDVDFNDCLRGRLDLDVAGSYSRNDAFKLTVEGLDLRPPV